MSDKYAAITAHWGQFPVQLMCRALDVSLSGYYEAKAHVAQGPSVRARADERLLVLVRAAFTKSHGRYVSTPTRIAHAWQWTSPVGSSLLASWAAGAARTFGGRRRSGWGQAGREGAVFPHAVTVAQDVDDMAVVDQAINQRRRHDFVSEDVASFLKGFVAGQHGRRVFVASAHELEEELSARPSCHGSAHWRCS